MTRPRAATCEIATCSDARTQAQSAQSVLGAAQGRYSRCIELADRAETIPLEDSLPGARAAVLKIAEVQDASSLDTGSSHAEGAGDDIVSIASFIGQSVPRPYNSSTTCAAAVRSSRSFQSAGGRGPNMEHASARSAVAPVAVFQIVASDQSEVVAARDRRWPSPGNNFLKRPRSNPIEPNICDAISEIFVG